MLTLKIENIDRLVDGGPLTCRVDRRGIDIGREQHLDWTLPDPTRRISGKHCEVRFRDGGYWLYDVSTNGTFVNKATQRVQSPYLLANGDELLIGDYIISVAVTGLAPAGPDPRRSPEPYADAPGAATSGDLWSSPTSAPPPINRRDLMPEPQRAARSADFLNSLANLPASRSEAWPPAAPAAPPPAAPTDLWSTGHPAAVPPAVPPAGAAWTAQAEPGRGAGSMAELTRDVPFGGAPRPAAPVSPGPAPETARLALEQEFLRQFAAGANVPEALFTGRKAAEFAFELGALMRIVSASLMQLLKVRAETKGIVRAADRTMIQARDNNALKFSPTPEAALAAMFGPATSGYLDHRQTIQKSFADLMTHEEATFAAMQHAILQLLEDLSPEAIGRESEGGKKSFLGSSKARHWDTFIERWNSKAGAGENGMLDAFHDLFADHYDRLTSKRRS